MSSFCTFDSVVIRLCCSVQLEHTRFMAPNIWSRWCLDPTSLPLLCFFSVFHLSSHLIKTTGTSDILNSGEGNCRMCRWAWKIWVDGINNLIFQSRRGEEWGSVEEAMRSRQRRVRRRRNGKLKAHEYRAQLQNGISLGSVSSILIGLILLIPPDVRH